MSGEANVVRYNNSIKARGSDLVFVIFIYIMLLLIFIVTLYPMLFVVSASVSNPAAVSNGDMILFPKGFTLDGYKRILEYGDIWLGYRNTIIYTVGGTFLSLAATLPVAYSLSRRDLIGRGYIMTLFIITMYFSGGLIPTYLNIQSLGLLNTRWVLLIGGLVSVFNMIVARTFFSSTIPWELHEAARIDGCSDFRIFTRIVLPLSKPIIVVLALYYGVGQWNQYFAAMIYLRNRDLFPLQLFLREILIQSRFAAAGILEARSTDEIVALLRQQDIANLLKYGIIVVSTAPMMAVYPWLQKYFSKGVMIGSVKG